MEKNIDRFGVEGTMHLPSETHPHDYEELAEELEHTPFLRTSYGNAAFLEEIRPTVVALAAMVLTVQLLFVIYLVVGGPQEPGINSHRCEL